MRLQAEMVFLINDEAGESLCGPICGHCNARQQRPAHAILRSMDAPRDPAELAFPITFDLRIIYVLAEGGTLREDLEGIMARRGVAWTLMQGDAKPGAKYGRFGVRPTMESREQMHGVYEDIGKLGCVKAAL